MLRAVKRHPDRPSPKNEKSVPLYGFDCAWRFIDSGKIRKKSEKFCRKKSLTQRHQEHKGSGNNILF